MHGKGVKIMANGDVYNGIWECDKAQVGRHPFEYQFFRGHD